MNKSYMNQNRLKISWPKKQVDNDYLQEGQFKSGLTGAFTFVFYVLFNTYFKESVGENVEICWSWWLPS